MNYFILPWCVDFYPASFARAAMSRPSCHLIDFTRSLIQALQDMPPSQLRLASLLAAVTGARHELIHCMQAAFDLQFMNRAWSYARSQGSSFQQRVFGSLLTIYPLAQLRSTVHQSSVEGLCHWLGRHGWGMASYISTITVMKWRAGGWPLGGCYQAISHD